MMRRGIAAGALVVAMLAAMPMPDAVGLKPYREQIRPTNLETGTFTIPANLLCPFAIYAEVEGQQVFWEFSDGHEAVSNNFAQTLTNLETGTSVDHQSTYHATTTFLADGTVVEVVTGTYFLGFLRGDQGPFGEVGRSGEAYFGDGRFTFEYDPAADVVTAFSWSGRLVDACQLLSS
jgi:hypothetical protein